MVLGLTQPLRAIIANNLAPLATIVVVTSIITLYYNLKTSYSRFITLNIELRIFTGDKDG